jgi:hypothetical protein
VSVTGTLDDNFGTEEYKLHTFISGCYFLTPKDVWSAEGVTVSPVSCITASDKA